MPSPGMLTPLLGHKIYTASDIVILAEKRVLWFPVAAHMEADDNFTTQAFSSEVDK